jgi:hypothetical protein
MRQEWRKGKLLADACSDTSRKRVLRGCIEAIQQQEVPDVVPARVMIRQDSAFAQNTF